MTANGIAAIEARYHRTSTRNPMWQEVRLDVAALIAEVRRLRWAMELADRRAWGMSTRPAPRCEHLRTLQAVVGDMPGFTSVQTVCGGCGAVLA